MRKRTLAGIAQSRCKKVQRGARRLYDLAIDAGVSGSAIRSMRSQPPMDALLQGKSMLEIVRRGTRPAVASAAAIHWRSGGPGWRGAAAGSGAIALRRAGCQRTDGGVAGTFDAFARGLQDRVDVALGHGALQRTPGLD